jgi:heme A synthase
MKTKTVAAAALAICVMTVDQAFAGFFSFTPSVPEFDGVGAVAALALLVSVVAIVYQRARRHASGGSSE